MFKNYIKIAWRTLLQSKGMSFLNIGGLAIATAGSILILLWVQNEISFDNYHKDADRINLLVVYDTTRAEYAVQTPFPAYSAIQEAVPEVELVTIAQPSDWSSYIFEINGSRFLEKNALYVDSNWTKMFTYQVIKGSLRDFTKSTNKVILSESKAKKYFGDLPPLEQSIYIDSEPYTIAAIVKDVPANSSFQQDMLIPNAILKKSRVGKSPIDVWWRYSQLLFVKLSAKADVQLTESKITEQFLKNQREPGSWSSKSRLIPLLDLHNKQELDEGFIKHGNPQSVRIFTILAVLLLITASINFVNLSIARISLRMKEIGVRKVVGAAKKQLFVQVMVETTLSIMLAIGLALLLAVLVLPYFNAFTEKHFVISLFDSSIVLLLLLVFVVVVLLTGPYPAVVLSMLKPIGLLKDRNLGGLSRQGFRKVLVVGQLTLGIVVLVGIMTIYQQFSFIQQQVAGYQKEQVFKVVTPAPNYVIRADDQESIDRYSNSLNSFKTSLLSSSAIQTVSRTNGVSMINDKDVWSPEIDWIGYPKRQERVDVVQLLVDEDYGRIANLELQSGRWFDATDVSDKFNLILNETAVKAYGLKQPVVGTLFTGGMYGDGGIVIGVVKDFHHKSLHEKIDPVIISLDPHFPSMYLVKTHAGSVKKALEDVQAIWSDRFPDFPFEYTFLDEEFDQLYKEDRRALSFSFIFGGLSILISCLGLLGMIVAVTQQRTNEIGIRKVLGASVSGIVTLLSKDFVKLVLIAILIATPIAWWAMNKWLQDFAYRIEMQWWMFALAGVLAVVIALLTVSFQAIKAAVANPVDSLRDE